MSSFSPDWLSLREPLDAASRAAGLAATLVDVLGRARSGDARIRIVDLGAGTGANLRYVAPLLGGSQDWILVERDDSVLEAMGGRMRSWARSCGAQTIESAGQLAVRGARFECSIHSVSLDLATGLGHLSLSGGTLLTASALLDLVSERWLRALARRAASSAATVWFTLTYSGHVECTPAEPDDLEVLRLFNAHQLSDKGFGAALGPAAGPTAQRLFAQQGYRTECAPSDWHVGADQAALQHSLVEGWFVAACEIAPYRTSALQNWLARRRAHIDAGRSELLVGHIDLMGYPFRV